MLTRWSTSFAIRTTTQTKPWICVALLAFAAGVELLRSFPAQPAIELTFVAYEDHGDTAVVEVRNRTLSDVVCNKANVCYDDPEDDRDSAPGMTLRPGMITLRGHGSRRLRVWLRYYRPSNISICYQPVPSRLRWHIEDLLSIAGVCTITGTGFVASVDLPPK